MKLTIRYRRPTIESPKILCHLTKLFVTKRYLMLTHTLLF